MILGGPTMGRRSEPHLMHSPAEAGSPRFKHTSRRRHSSPTNGSQSDRGPTADPAALRGLPQSEGSLTDRPALKPSPPASRRNKLNRLKKSHSSDYMHPGAERINRGVDKFTKLERERPRGAMEPLQVTKKVRAAFFAKKLAGGRARPVEHLGNFAAPIVRRRSADDEAREEKNSPAWSQSASPPAPDPSPKFGRRSLNVPVFEEEDERAGKNVRMGGPRQQVQLGQIGRTRTLDTMLTDYEQTRMDLDAAAAAGEVISGSALEVGENVEVRVKRCLRWCNYSCEA